MAEAREREIPREYKTKESKTKKTKVMRTNTNRVEGYGSLTESGISPPCPPQPAAPPEASEEREHAAHNAERSSQKEFEASGPLPCFRENNTEVWQHTQSQLLTPAEPGLLEDLPLRMLVTTTTVPTC